MRVLLLDDDNHDYTVMYEDNYRCSMQQFLHNMAAPHSIRYEIRIVHLVDLPCEAVRVGPFVMDMGQWFDVCDCGAVPRQYAEQRDFCREAAFDLLWGRSNAYA